jgi:hypothetical protein
MPIPEFRETELLGIVMDFVSFRETFTPKPRIMTNRIFKNFTIPYRLLFSLLVISVLVSCKNQDPENLSSGPITAESIRLAKIEFNQTYAVASGLNNKPLKVELSDTLITLFNNLAALTDKGLVFHYGYIESKKEICLLIGLGSQKRGEMTFTNYPFPAKPGVHGEYYLVFAANETHLKVRGTSAHNSLTQSYQAKIQHNGTVIRLNKDHPKMVYHQGQELKKFYDEYRMGNPLYLYAYNGSRQTPGVAADYHIPIFLFGNDGVPFPTDDVIYPDYGLHFPYRNKALDAGHVCPPHCIKSTP